MSFVKHIPNAITCSNLISGCISTVFALQAEYKCALLWIVIGAVFDFFDGMSARLLHVSSDIGKELDSLADDITFGVAPSSMVFTFLYTLDCPSFLSSVSCIIPFVAFLMAAFSALRLAKFNLDERQTTSFIGLPTPANALFWGSLIVGLGTRLESLSYAMPLIIIMLFVSCWLLVSEIPMFALKFKHWGWKGNEVKYVFLLTCVPLIIFFGITSLAIIIAWYVVLSCLTSRLTSRPSV